MFEETNKFAIQTGVSNYKYVSWNKDYKKKTVLTLILTDLTDNIITYITDMYGTDHIT